MTRVAAAVAAVLVTLATVVLAAPANDDCANATVITSLPFTDTADMATATVEPGEPTDCVGGGTHSVWYRIPAGSPDVLYRARLDGSVAPADEARIAQYTGSCDAPVLFGCSSLGSLALPRAGIAPRGHDILLAVQTDGGTLAFQLEQLPEFLIGVPDGVLSTVAGGPNGFLTTFGEGVKARLYDTAGNALGTAMSLSSTGFRADSAAAGTGSFVVVWKGLTGIEGARVDGPDDVVPLPPLVSTTSSRLRVAADDDGDFVVVWVQSGLKGQRFDAAGMPKAPAFQVNTSTTSFGDGQAVAMAPDGRFVAVWSADDGDDAGIRGRVFDAAGAPLGDDFMVNQGTAGKQDRPGVGMDAAGEFVVSWLSNEDIGPFNSPVLARRFDAGGSPLGDEFLVNTENFYPHTGYKIDVAMAPAGEFVVTWEAYTTGSQNNYGLADTDIAARRFSADGTAEGSQFFVNTLQTYYQYDPDVGVTPDGSFMVVWEDYDNLFDLDTDPSASGAVGRVLLGAPPCSPAPLAGCRQPTVPEKSKLLVVDDPDPLHDVIRWTWSKGQATGAPDFGNPLGTDAYALCLYDATDATVFDARIPAAGTCGRKPCWKGLGTPPGATGFKYADKLRTPEGIQKLVLKAGIEGKAKVVVKGGGPNLGNGRLALPSLPLLLPARLQLQGPGGTCWEATFSSAGVTTNSSSEFGGTGG